MTDEPGFAAALDAQDSIGDPRHIQTAAIATTVAAGAPLASIRWEGFKVRSEFDQPRNVYVDFASFADGQQSHGQDMHQVLKSMALWGESVNQAQALENFHSSLSIVNMKKARYPEAMNR